MGVTGAWPFWKRTCQDAFSKPKKSELVNKKLAIDGNILCTSCLKTTLSTKDDWKIEYMCMILQKIMLCHSLTNSWPVIVFDGAHPNCKSHAHAKRQAAREKAESQLKIAHQTEDDELIEKAMRNACRFTKELENWTIGILEKGGISILIAKGEAERACAELSYQGGIYAVVTEDSDTLVCGGTRVLRGICRSGEITLVDRDKILEAMHMSPIRFRLWAGIVGTDFHPGLDSIGCVRAKKLLSSLNDDNCHATILENKPEDVKTGIYEAILQFGEWDKEEESLSEIQKEIMQNIQNCLEMDNIVIELDRQGSFGSLEHIRDRLNDIHVPTTACDDVEFIDENNEIVFIA